MDLEYPEDFSSSEDRHLSPERRISDSGSEFASSACSLLE